MPSPITLTSPLPDTDLVFESMTSTAGLSTLGELQLNLLSLRSNVEPEALLGKLVTVNVELPDDTKRHFNGYVTRFAIGSHRGRYFSYQATVRPWLWFLTRTTDCKIFQEKTVPDIVKEVFQDHGIANFEFKLFRSYRTRTYCVQYRESDYNFIARLLEDEGIYWYFEHSAAKHKLVLVDSLSAHDAAPECESLRYLEAVSTKPPDFEYVTGWVSSRQVEAGKLVLTSYDFERPSADLVVDKSQEREYDLSDYEVFDFQGDYVKASDGTQLAEDRLDEAQSRYQTLRGRSNARAMDVGRLFTLEQHPRDDQNADYLITGLTVSAQTDAYESGQGSERFEASFNAVPAEQQFRPQRRTPKPFVQGPQTAVVVGPSGEEIHTDKHGRVKVQFHWDRYHQKNEESSCWMRVSHPWAGKGWGSVSIPRIGQEVIVDFLEGDPDQPIVTGRVYNGENMAPFQLPGAAATSGMKSKTHRGGGFNEISADDTKGKEKVNIHAEYDMTTKVKHDQTNTVDNKFTETIKSDAKITVLEGTYDHNVAANTAKYHVKGALTELYDATQSTTVQDALTIKSTAGTISVSADAKNVYVHAATKIELITGSSSLTMESSGKISLKGTDVTVEGSKIVLITGDIVHSEAKNENHMKGGVVLTHGESTNTVKGAMVMLNPD